MTRLAFAACVTACLGGPSSAETDVLHLTPTERAILGQEIRAVLLTVPELLPMDRPAPDAADLYAEAIEDDLARLKTHASALFSPNLPGFGPAGATHTIALFTRDNCPDCTRAETDLRALAKRHDLRVTLLDMEENSALADALQLDIAPSYVFPDQMLRGHIPAIVLERYLED
ncbi:glutaredoxin family protein [Roseovarius indicus]|uniref:Uncharacterized protein n=1 Tax=Roseovarius indicus TaxID=540747 RepID=A0A5P3ADG7_9RHOB|nr:glutaredoxin family protein [Roseovarius indicus]QEW27372.1 hypothetical protein RIdsm_03184 [Roseovarius indicus]SFD49560.1 Glutaredoxin-like domain [Roseovarius indicus]